MLSLCNGWEFTPRWTEEFALGEGTAEAVRLPHTARQIPLHYADPDSYQMICGYRRSLPFQDSWQGKRVFLQFDGAAHIATVYLNGRELIHHRTGYTGFRVEITDALSREGENRLAVKLDTTENPQVPPFGFVIDYLTYGGLYREVWLDVREQSFIEDLFITTPTLTTLAVETTLSGGEGMTLLAEVIKGGRTLARQRFLPGQKAVLNCPGVKPWGTEHPVRYTCRVSLMKDGAPVDTVSTKFGFRTIEFRENSFFLNGKAVFLRGLNRHQCYPYVGYAVPETLQREDARILKEELSCVAVRTSHYPQSHHFLDECDRLGLLVFTELPGWQHIGDDAWKDQAVENVREMITQYRNHPSIVLWGVRINESLDDDEFYLRTNDLAHRLDPSRPTSGVRHREKSSLLEDVYSYNDFSHTGDNSGVRPKKAVTPDLGKALIITEHNGHMFPTKAFDTWQRRQSHALRHARVQSDAAGDGGHAGCFGWCMFDYPTHGDFGSGDRVCYHGVMDAFRNPKLAAALYASQGEQTPVLELGSTMDIGDYPGGEIGAVSVFTNADSVCLYKNGEFVTQLRQDTFAGLPHPPFVLDDPIGCLLERHEGFDAKKARLIRSCLLAIRNKGLAKLSPGDMAKMGYVMVRYGLTYADALTLYGKYVGNWGGSATLWTLEGKKDGQVVSSITRGPSTRLHLEAKASHTLLKEGGSYDMAAVRIRILDEFGCAAPYAQLPVRFHLEGPGQLVGPDVVTAEGGMTGTYLKTTGVPGEITLTITTAQTEAVTLSFQAEI